MIGLNLGQLSPAALKALEALPPAMRKDVRNSVPDVNKLYIQSRPAILNLMMKGWRMRVSRFSRACWMETADGLEADVKLSYACLWGLDNTKTFIPIPEKANPSSVCYRLTEEGEREAKYQPAEPMVGGKAVTIHEPYAPMDAMINGYRPEPPGRVAHPYHPAQPAPAPVQAPVQPAPKPSVEWDHDVIQDGVGFVMTLRMPDFRGLHLAIDALGISNPNFVVPKPVKEKRTYRKREKAV